MKRDKKALHVHSAIQAPYGHRWTSWRFWITGIALFTQDVSWYAGDKGVFPLFCLTR